MHSHHTKQNFYHFPEPRIPILLGRKTYLTSPTPGGILQEKPKNAQIMKIDNFQVEKSLYTTV